MAVRVPRQGEKERTESQTRNGAALGTLGPWEYMGYTGNFSVQRETF